MITQVTLREFQCHQMLDLTLERVTVLVGPTGAGKSAVLRAIRWVLLNQPQGDGFVRKGTKGCSVVLQADDHRITRRKGAAGNGYSLDGEDYKAFGMGVPDAIAQLLNVGPDSVAKQHDAPYWFGLTPGQVARELNAVISLDAIDTALGNAASAVRKATTAHEAAVTQLSEAQTTAQTLAWVPEAVKDYTTVKCTKDNASQIAASASQIDALVTAARLAQERVTMLSGAGSALARAVAGAAPDPRLEILGGLVAEGRQLEAESCRLAQDRGEQEAELQRLTKGRCPTCQRPLLPLRS